MSPTGVQDRPLPLPLARRVDALCQRFEDAWRAVATGAERPRLQAHLDGVVEPARGVLLRELLRIEAHYRRLAGEEPRADDYPAHLPDLSPDGLAHVLAPNPDPQLSLPIHQLALVVNGVHLLENLKLDELAAKQVYEFAFMMQPIKLQGGTGSTVSPVAVR